MRWGELGEGHLMIGKSGDLVIGNCGMDEAAVIGKKLTADLLLIILIYADRKAQEVAEVYAKLG